MRCATAPHVRPICWVPWPPSVLRVSTNATLWPSEPPPKTGRRWPSTTLSDLPSALKRPRIDPGSAQHRTRIDSDLTRNRPHIDPRTTPDRHGIDPGSTRSRLVLDPGSRPLSGQLWTSQGSPGVITNTPGRATFRQPSHTARIMFLGPNSSSFRSGFFRHVLGIRSPKLGLVCTKLGACVPSSLGGSTKPAQVSAKLVGFRQIWGGLHEFRGISTKFVPVRPNLGVFSTTSGRCSTEDGTDTTGLGAISECGAASTKSEVALRPISTRVQMCWKQHGQHVACSSSARDALQLRGGATEAHVRRLNCIRSETTMAIRAVSTTPPPTRCANAQRPH